MDFETFARLASLISVSVNRSIPERANAIAVARPIPELLFYQTSPFPRSV